MPTSDSIILRARYYETDSMKIVHHVNYVKWMEEARQEFFRNAGFNWRLMEETTGIMIPVLFQSVEYIRMIKFDDEVEVLCVCDHFNGVKMNFSYVFRNPTKDTVYAKGITKHGFIDASYKPVALQKEYDSGFRALNNYINRG